MSAYSPFGMVGVDENLDLGHAIGRLWEADEEVGRLSILRRINTGPDDMLGVRE